MSYEHVWNSKLSENQRDALFRCISSGTDIKYSDNAKRVNWLALTERQRERLLKTDWNVVLGEVVLQYPVVTVSDLAFDVRMNEKLGSAATAKGYDGPSGQLLGLCKDLPHPVGEIVYKAVRYARKGDPDDLVKIAAWAKLIWQQQHAQAQQPESHSTSRCT